MLVAISYHYIDHENKYQAGIYPTSPERFAKQLTQLAKTFTFVGDKEITAAITGASKLPAKSCMITFDDGLQSQFKKAIPILEEKNIPATFYINTLPLRSKKACLIHKMHYLLSQIKDDQLLEQVTYHYQQITGQQPKINEAQLRKVRKENPDDKHGHTLKLKYLLNNHCTQALSDQILNKILQDYFKDQSQFCSQLYMNKEQLRTINRHPLFNIGLHTESHINIPYSTKQQVAQEIIDNYHYLKNELKIDDISGISYPYGIISQRDFADKIRQPLKKLGIKYGLTAIRGINHDLRQPLFLKRFGTNDIVGGKRPIINF